MSWEVKNVVKAQSKYGLMGSSAKTGKKKFYGSQEQFFDETVIWDRTPPQLYIKYSVYVWGRAHGSQIFKRNSIILICSKVIASLVICCPRSHASSPRRLCIVSRDNVVPVVPVIPVVPVSSLLSP